MKYVLVVHEGPEGLATLRDPARCGPYMGAWGAYAKALVDAGVFAGGAGLQLPETATAVRKAAGKVQVQDGPFADSKEQLAGFFQIDVPDLDKAIEWAGKSPIADGGVMEVRPAIVGPN
ncbi:YciI family protein [Oryzibacter oryziterrae]|uniref:YciI family protein n=1 Tax=Oryzibacter oryziterrae TaxID=2766474 RepID=UPI001F1AD7A2|nr:YciI family protein [Oryzibacter oryziterrae]